MTQDNVPVTAEELEAFANTYPGEPVEDLRQGTWHPSSRVEVAYALSELANDVHGASDLARSTFNILGETRQQMRELEQFVPMLTRLAAHEQYTDSSIAEQLQQLRDGAAVASGELQSGTAGTPATFVRPDDEDLPAVRQIHAHDYDNQAS